MELCQKGPDLKRERERERRIIEVKAGREGWQKGVGSFSGGLHPTSYEEMPPTAANTTRNFPSPSKKLKERGAAREVKLK